MTTSVTIDNHGPGAIVVKTVDPVEKTPVGTPKVIRGGDGQQIYVHEHQAIIIREHDPNVNT